MIINLTRKLLAAFFAAFVIILAVVISDTAFASTLGIVDSSIGLKMRTGPGTDYDILIVLNDNTQVNVLAKNGSWYKVEYNGIEGYVSADYIRTYEYVSNQTATVSSSIGLNVRTGPGVSYEVIYTLLNNSVVEILDHSGNWCKISYNGIVGYVSAAYLIIDEDVEYEYDEAFELYMTEQGFPESYKPYLRKLHALHPKWVFKSQNTGLNWMDVIAKESVLGVNLVHKSADDSWKSKEPGAFDASGQYIEFDSGGWIAASAEVIKYYMDPRNFLNEGGIFQFMSHSYDADTQTKLGLQQLVANTFLAGKFPENGYDTYSDALIYAGQKSGANPYVLASMILVEQGKDGSGRSISGTVSGFEGYYNFFNVRAYASGTYDAVQYGLLYAKDQGWNTRIKSIVGGAIYYAKNYIKNNQNTLYLKKFNVMNGKSNVATHQYMTNVGGAANEASNLKKGYENYDTITFYIPIYNNMPASACKLPNDSQTASKYYERLAGQDRYDTSVKVAKEYAESTGKAKFDTVIVASGEDYADALSGSYLASFKEAPILLVGNDAISQNKIYTYISQNLSKAGTIYILGGEGAVSLSFEKMLSGYDVKRLGGKTRFETNIKIIKEVGVIPDEILVCSGMDFADGLSVSATGKAVLLVNETLTDEQKEYLRSFIKTSYYLIGGNSVVSDKIESELASYGKTKRIYGENRYSTSVAVAKEFFGNSCNTAVLTYGLNFPDGLSAGPLASYVNAPLILVNDKNISSAQTFAKEFDINKFYVLGGETLITEYMISAILN